MDDNVFAGIKESFEKILSSPETILDMRRITGVNVSCALLLKAFFDEFKMKYEKKPNIRSPKHKKVRTIFNYLGLSKYHDVERFHYRDVDCWQIRSWEQDDNANIPFSQILDEEIIPKCWTGDRSMSQHSSSIATSVS